MNQGVAVSRWSSASVMEHLAGKLGWTVEQLKKLVNICNGYGLYIDEVRSLPGIFPDPTVTPKYDWAGLVEVMGTKLSVTEWEGGVIDDLVVMGSRDEMNEKAEELWPLRTKTDGDQRRTRFFDVIQGWRTLKKPDALLYVLRRSKGWDQIHLCNVAWMALILGDEWVENMDRLGLIGGLMDDWFARAKELTRILKVVGLQDKKWFHYVELQHLVGYRNPPVAGFDPVESAAELANSGHDFDWFGWDPRELAGDIMTMNLADVEQFTFYEWVLSGKWVTSGSASGYKIDVEVDNENVRVRVSKTNFIDVRTPEEATQHALSQLKMVNNVFVKNETGKMRIAVAGDMDTYLKMTYIKHYMAGASTKWPGAIRGEDFDKQRERMALMLELLRTMYSLPFDWEKFDHQGRRYVFLIFLERVFVISRVNVGPALRKEFDEIAENVFKCAQASEMVLHDDGKIYIWTVHGWLESGIAFTSDMGDAGDGMITYLCTRIMQTIGVSLGNSKYWIMGDDSTQIYRNWAMCALAERVMAAIGAIGGVSKFSVRKGETELLRLWYDDDGVHGYPARVIVGLTQRKPWSNDPWQPQNVIDALADACYTLARRTGEHNVCQALLKSLVRTWVRMHNVKFEVAWATTMQGGLGLFADEKVRVVQPPLPRFSDMAVDLRIVNQTTWREKILRDGYERDYGIVIDTKAISERKAKQSLVTDGTYGAIKGAVAKWKDEMKIVREVKVLEVPFLWSIPPDFEKLDVDNFDVTILRAKTMAPTWGVCPELAKARADYADIRPPFSFGEWLRKYYFTAHQRLKTFHRSWHRSEAIDYLIGDTGAPKSRLHPSLRWIGDLFAATSFQPNQPIVHGQLSTAAGVIHEIVANTPFARKLYTW